MLTTVDPALPSNPSSEGLHCPIYSYVLWTIEHALTTTAFDSTPITDVNPYFTRLYIGIGKYKKYRFVKAHDDLATTSY